MASALRDMVLHPCTRPSRRFAVNPTKHFGSALFLPIATPGTQMSVPILTIPETSFDPTVYMPASHARRSRLLRFMLTLSRTSALALIAAYLVGLLAIRPLMATAVEQRSEFLQACRTRLRDLYMNVICRVEYIPSISIERANGAIRKIYADSVCQTEDLQSLHTSDSCDCLGQTLILEKLKILRARLDECLGYLVQEMGHFHAIDFAIKNLQQKAELVYFDHAKLFLEPGPVASRKPRNMAREVKQGIRSIKGIFMSGRA